MTAEKLLAEPFRLEGFTDEEIFGVVRDLFGDPDGSWGIAAIYHVDVDSLSEALADTLGYGLGPREQQLVEALVREVDKAGVPLT